MKRMLSIFIVLLGLIFFPLPAMAVDYSIEQTQIDAYLLEEGHVNVTEVHTYKFDGEFNGMTRTLIPKEKTEIVDFEAKENGSTLAVEHENDLYRIYRNGEDETVTIELTYTVYNAVLVYEDIADFYYPFFDNRNESDYEQLDVYVHPPAESDAKEAIAYGEDEAEGTASVLEGGVVHFEMGKVNSGKNGNIRVAYDPSLFSVDHRNEGKMRNEILAEISALEKSRERYENRVQFFDEAALFILGSYVMYVLVIAFILKRRRNSLFWEMERSSATIPKDEEMSMPAIIAYMKYGLVNSDVLTAALLDLVRKEHVKREDDEVFKVVDWNASYKHERQLMAWLFDKIGADGVFSYTDLKEYLKKTENQKVYHTDFEAWKKEIQAEVAENQLNERKVKQRVFLGATSLPLLIFGILLATHGLFMWMSLSIILFLILAGMASFYHPRSVKGAKIFSEWKDVMKRYSQIEEKQWQELADDEQKRIFIFAFGRNRSMVELKQKKLEANQNQLSTSTTDIALFFLIATVANEQFNRANKTAAAATAPGGGSSGGGAGGGGGGSGAF